jgi:ferritin-like metal-binding protein YciE
MKKVTKMSSQSAGNGHARSGSQAREQEGQMNNELHQLFLDELADLYNAEQQLTKALPKMAKAAESDELREAFESHLEETKGHVTRLEVAREPHTAEKD